MASFNGGKLFTPAPRLEMVEYRPLMPGGGGGEPVDPKRFLNVGGEAVPIQ